MKNAVARLVLIFLFVVITYLVIVFARDYLKIRHVKNILSEIMSYYDIHGFYPIMREFHSRHPELGPEGNGLDGYISYPEDGKPFGCALGYSLPSFISSFFKSPFTIGKPVHADFVGGIHHYMVECKWDEQAFKEFQLQHP